MKKDKNQGDIKDVKPEEVNKESSLCEKALLVESEVREKSIWEIVMDQNDWLLTL